TSGPDRHPRGFRRIRARALARRTLAGISIRPDRADGSVRAVLSGARCPHTGVAAGWHRAGVGAQWPGAVLSLGGQSHGRVSDAVTCFGDRWPPPAVHQFIPERRTIPRVRRSSGRSALHHGQWWGGAVHTVRGAECFSAAVV